jgi:hypothetical protein
MTTIYAVESGEYSGYRVDALFSSQELAELWLQNYGSSDSAIREFELDPNITQLKEGLWMWYVWMTEDGDTRSVGKDVNFTGEGLYISGYGLRVVTYATSEQHAVKIANEKRIQIIARNLWKNGIVVL